MKSCRPISRSSSTCAIRAILSRASLGELHAKVGERAAALHDASAAIAAVNEMPEDPTHSQKSSFRAQVYTSVAATHALLAGSEAATAREQREQWSAAREMYVRSLEIWVDMQRRGILPDLDATSAAEVTREIARCDENLRKLPAG
jgi:predicted trehalose synthase